MDGGPGAIRTHDLPLRRGTLYPAELRGLEACSLSQVIAALAGSMLRGEIGGAWRWRRGTML